MPRCGRRWNADVSNGRRRSSNCSRVGIHPHPRESADWAAYDPQRAAPRFEPMRLACAVARRGPSPVTRRRRRLRYRLATVGCSPRRFSWPSREPRSTGSAMAAARQRGTGAAATCDGGCRAWPRTPRRRRSSRNGWRARRQTRSGSRRRPRVGAASARAKAEKARAAAAANSPASAGSVLATELQRAIAAEEARAGRREGWGCSAGERCVRSGAPKPPRPTNRRGPPAATAKGRQAHPYRWQDESGTCATVEVPEQYKDNAIVVLPGD